MRSSSMLKWSIFSALATPTLALGSARLLHNRRIQNVRRALSATPSQEVFSEELIADLPDVVQRYFRHAIQPGAPLVSSGKMQIRGRSKVEPEAEYMSFVEQRTITPHRGGLWELRVETKPWKLAWGYYADGTGREESAYYGVIPIRMINTPLHISKVFLERSMFESIFVPSTLLPQHGVTWEARDQHHACAKLAVDGQTLALDLTIDDQGSIKQVLFDHWNIKGTGYKWRYIPCSYTIHAENTFDGYTIPSHYTITFWHNSAERGPGLSVEYWIDEVSFS